MSAERERRAIKLLILARVLRRHFGVSEVQFGEQPGTELDEIANISPKLSRETHQFLIEALDLLRLRIVLRPGEDVFPIRLDNLETTSAMITRLPDQSPRSLLDTVTTPDEAFWGMNMIEMIRVGDAESYDRCLRQLAGDGYT